MTTTMNAAWAALRAGLCAALLGTLILPVQAQFGGGGNSCDPTRQSCAPGGGGPGGGGTGGNCTPVQQALGLCTPGGGGGGGGGGTCTAPPGGGNTGCGGAGAASQGGGTGGGTQVGGGNPINLISGNKHQEEVDLAPLPGVLGLEFKRYYNSDSRQRGLTGVGWRSSYETVLVDLGRSIQIVQADGRRLEFARGIGARSQLCTSTSLADGQVRIEQGPNGKPLYHWRWLDGRTLTFGGGLGAGQPLQAITAASGERSTLAYNPLGDLVEVRDPAGRRLSFVYGKPAAGQRAPLLAIETPLGRIAYRHDEMGRLVDVRHAVDAQAAPHRIRSYHYEAARQAGNPFALTGISVGGTDTAGRTQAVQRVSTYAYDAQGRGVLSTKGEPLRREGGKVVEGTGIDQIQVEYASAPQWLQPRIVDGEARPTQLGRTIVTDAQGGKTEVLSAVIGGQYRLVQMRGAGCSTCGPVDRSYGWDVSGRLVRSTTLDAQGRPVTSEIRQYDLYGRLTRLGLRRDDAMGKSQPVQWTERYEYADAKYADGSVAVAARPALIARPSVQPGQEHVLRIDYNDAWQPVKVRESGYSPIDEKGELQPTLIERSTRYTYSRINGRSLLTQVDGPLPNGPKGDPSDSDITRLTWNERGDAVVRIVYPAGLAASFEHDPATGQLLRHVGVDGVATRWHYARGGSVEAIDRAGAVTRFALDAQDRMVEVVDPIGQAMRLGYDAAGRIASLGDAQRNTITFERDSDGRLLRTQLLNPDGSVAQTGRLYDTDLAASAPGSDAVLAAVGSLAQAAQSAGSLARPESATQAYAALSAFTGGGPREPAIATSTALDSDGRITTYWKDDFGRLVRVQSPTTGMTRFFYDAADRLAGRLQQDGSRADYARDAAGRVVAVRAQDANGHVDEDAAIEWGAANKPTRVRYLAGEERFAYDAAGRLVEHLQSVDGKNFRIAYAFDTSGRMTTRTLPDGRVLDYRYRGAVHPRAGLLESVWLRGFAGEASQRLSGGLLDRPVVRDLNDEADRFTRRGFSFGNGLTSRLELDAQGRVISAGNAQVGQTALAYPAGPAASAAPTSPTDDTSKPLRVDMRRSVALGQQARAELTQAWISRLHAKWAGTTRQEADGGSTAAQPANPLLETRRDLLGRQMSRGDQRLHYDSLGRLVEVGRVDAQGTESLVARYRYNLFGQRIAKAVASADGHGTRTTYFLHDGSQLVAEADDSGVVGTQYVWVNDKPVAMLRDGRLYAIHTDHRNAPLALTDESRAVVWQASVADFLLATPAQGDTLGRIRFNLRGSNQYADAETGLHYNTHRYFDPVAARYLTPDPLGLAVGPDLYAFAMGRPHSMSDPLGLAPIVTDADVPKSDFADRIQYVFEKAAQRYPGEVGDALRELVSPTALATTAGIFAVWAVAQATPFGWAADLVLAGVGYALIGKSIYDVLDSFISTSVKVYNAKCLSDLDQASEILAKGLGNATATMVAGGATAGASKVAQMVRQVLKRRPSGNVTAPKSSAPPPPPPPVSLNSLKGQQLVGPAMSRWGKTTNDGALGEQLAKQMLEALTGGTYRGIHNASGNGPDLIRINTLTKTIEHVEVKSSQVGSPGWPAGNGTTRFMDWIAEAANTGKIAGKAVSPQDQAYARTLLDLLNNQNYKLDNKVFQVTIPAPNSSGNPIALLSDWT